MRPDLRKRLADSIETAVGLADGIVEVEIVPREGDRQAAQVLTFSEKFACLKCGTSMPELEPRIFSFNSPHGACERCTGLGSQMEIDPELVVPDPTLSIGEGALAPWASSASQYYEQITLALAEQYDVDLDTPWQDLPRRAPRPVPRRHRRRARPRHLQEPLRARALLLDALRGHRPEPRAPLPRDGLRHDARAHRGVHGGRAVPGVQGLAPAARVARRARRRHGDPRVHGAVGAPGAALARRGRADRDRAPHRAADPARDRGAAALPRERRDRLPLARPRARRRCPAARRSGSAWRRRSARRSSACSTSSTSRRSACTSATTRS